MVLVQMCLPPCRLGQTDRFQFFPVVVVPAGHFVCETVILEAIVPWLALSLSSLALAEHALDPAAFEEPEVGWAPTCLQAACSCEYRAALLKRISSCVVYRQAFWCAGAPLWTCSQCPAPFGSNEVCPPGKQPAVWTWSFSGLRLPSEPHEGLLWSSPSRCLNGSLLHQSQ